MAGWGCRDQLALSQIQLCVKPRLLRLIEGCESAGEAWALLHDTFQARTTARRTKLMEALTGLTMGPHESVLRYITRAKALRDSVAYLALSATVDGAPNVAARGTWVIDSGATHHMAQAAAPFTSYNRTTGDHVRLANNTSVAVEGRGTVLMQVAGTHRDTPVALQDFVHVPSLSRNLLSVGAVDRRGGAVVFVGGHCLILRDGAALTQNGALSHADLVGTLAVPGQYILESSMAEKAACAVKAVLPAEAALRHRRYNHLGSPNLRRVAGMTTGMPLAVAIAKPAAGTVCPPCAEGRLTRAPFSRAGPKAVAMDPLELVHTDVCGPLPYSIGGCRYFVSLVDTATRLKVAIPVRTKADAATAVERQLMRLETLCKGTIRRVRHDGGGEYLTSTLRDFYTRRGVTPETTAPYTPQQSGVAERLNRTVMERARAMLADAGAEQDLWAEVLAAAVYVFVGVE